MFGGVLRLLRRNLTVNKDYDYDCWGFVLDLFRNFVVACYAISGQNLDSWGV